MASGSAQPSARMDDSLPSSTLEDMRQRMISTVEKSALTEAERAAMLELLVENDFSISRLINIAANSFQDDFFTRASPSTAPNCIRLCCYLLPHVDVDLKECFVQKIGSIVASHGEALADIHDYLPKLLNATILALDRSRNAPEDAKSGKWVYCHLLVPLLLSANRPSSEQDKPFRWARNALQLVQTDTNFPGERFAEGCANSIRMLSAIKVPEGFVLLRECMARATQILNLEDSTMLLMLCLEACKQPQASTELKWQAIKTIRLLTKTPTEGAWALETLMALQLHRIQETLKVLKDAMNDQDWRMKQAARDTLIDLRALYEKAEIDLKALKQIRAEKLASARRSKAELHSSAKVNGTQPAETWIADVMPPAVPNEGARREMASSSGDKSSTPDNLGMSEVVVVFESPNEAAAGASDHLAQQSIQKSKSSEVLRRDDGSISQPVEYEEVMTSRKSRSMIKKIKAFATCFTGDTEGGQSEMARKSRVVEMTNGRKSDSASSEAITDETGSTSSKKEKKRRNSFKRAFAGCFKPTPSETDPSADGSQSTGKLAGKERIRAKARTWGFSIAPSCLRTNNANREDKQDS